MRVLLVILSIICVFESVLLLYANHNFVAYVCAFFESCKSVGIVQSIKKACAVVIGYLLASAKKCFQKVSFKNNNQKKIAFYPTGGLGDYIVSAKVLEEIQGYVPEVHIDVFVDKLQFGRAIYGNRDNVGLNEGILYELVKRKYALALRVEHFVHVDCFKKGVVKSWSPELLKRISYIVDNWRDLYVDIPQQCWRERIQFERCKVLGLDRWTELRMGYAFDVDSKYIQLPMLDEYKEKWNKRGYSPKSYITINYGTDIMRPNQIQLKMWNKESLEQLVHLVCQNIPNIKVIQLGSRDAKRIRGCDDYILGESIELTKWILKDSLCHIDCEGGLVHLAHQVGTKSIVIFGPTPIHMYAYKENYNLVFDGCNNCMGLYEDWAYKCFSGKEGQCVNMISPLKVFELIHRIDKSEESR